MKRREALIYIGLAFLAANKALGKTNTPKALTENWKGFLNAANGEPVEAFPKINMSSEQWKLRLPESAYKVLFEEDTEPRFSSDLNDEKRRGIYQCRACNLAIFTSEMKYDSKTGWPSFFSCISDHIETKVDYRIIIPRTEYHCKKCGGHQGHVFLDGPAPTFERWCNNGASLTFVPSV